MTDIRHHFYCYTVVFWPLLVAVDRWTSDKLEALLSLYVADSIQHRLETARRRGGLDAGPAGKAEHTSCSKRASGAAEQAETGLLEEIKISRADR